MKIQLASTVLLVHVIAVYSFIDDNLFCYQVDDQKCGPSNWGGSCTTGKFQSPIPVPYDKKTKFKPTKFFESDEDSDRVRSFYGQNGGHIGVQFSLNSNPNALASKLAISGGDLNGTYYFGFFNLHWGESDSEGSEHTLNGKRYPLETHVVYYKEMYSSFNDAAASKNDPEAIFVLGTLYKIGKQNKYLDKIVQSLPILRVPGDVKEFKFALSLTDLYPKDKKFARYLGSTTTPPCLEKIIWTFFLKPLEVSKNQLKEFRKIQNTQGKTGANFRPLQPLYGRSITFYDALMINVKNSWVQQVLG